VIGLQQDSAYRAGPVHPNREPFWLALGRLDLHRRRARRPGYSPDRHPSVNDRPVCGDSRLGLRARPRYNLARSGLPSWAQGDLRPATGPVRPRRTHHAGRTLGGHGGHPQTNGVWPRGRLLSVVRYRPIWRNHRERPGPRRRRNRTPPRSRPVRGLLRCSTAEWMCSTPGNTRTWHPKSLRTAP